MGKEFDIDAYLERIGVDSAISISEDFLERSHRAHTYTIPFENFDILLGRGIDLSPEKLFQKIILNSRGGYCFELNGLYLQLLRLLGFQVKPLLARVHLRGEPGGRHHQLTLVTLNDRDWIADVGFGANGLRAPIPYETDVVHRQDGLDFRLMDSPPFGTMLQIREQERWQNLYSFELGHVCSGDIDSGNHYTSTSPGSYFTWARVATLPNVDGRVSLNDFTLTIVSNSDTRVLQLEHDASYLEKLREFFGIVIDAPYETINPLNQKPDIY